MLVNKHRYRELRTALVALIQGQWHTYYVGNLAVGRKFTQDADLIARLVRGLQVAGLVTTCLKRNDEGIIEYRLFTLEKIDTDMLDAAMVMTSKKGEAFIPPMEPER
jgi:hypothetical protein